MSYRCRCCGGEGMVLGALGRKLWLRCRRCWAEWYEDGTHYE